MLHQEAVTCNYESHSRLRQEQPLEKHAALLMDEVFSVILGTINTQHGTASRSRKTQNGSDLSEDEVFESYHLPHVPDTPIIGSCHGHKITFRSPAVRPGLVSYKPCLSLSQCPSICLEFLTLKHQGRTQTVR